MATTHPSSSTEKVERGTGGEGGGEELLLLSELIGRELETVAAVVWGARWMKLGCGVET